MHKRHVRVSILVEGVFSDSEGRMGEKERSNPRKEYWNTFHGLQSVRKCERESTADWDLNLAGSDEDLVMYEERAKITALKRLAHKNQSKWLCSSLCLSPMLPLLIFRVISRCARPLITQTNCNRKAPKNRQNTTSYKKGCINWPHWSHWKINEFHLYCYYNCYSMCGYRPHNSSTRLSRLIPLHSIPQHSLTRRSP